MPKSLVEYSPVLWNRCNVIPLIWKQPQNEFGFALFPELHGRDKRADYHESSFSDYFECPKKIPTWKFKV